MSRAYRMVAYLEIDATLSAEDRTFWQDTLYRCIDDPMDVLEGQEQESDPEDVEIQPLQGGIRFFLDKERYLCNGYSQEEYAEDFRRAMHLLTQDAVPDFKVSLNMYYLERDPDLDVEYDRQELAA